MRQEQPEPNKNVLKKVAIYLIGDFLLGCSQGVNELRIKQFSKSCVDLLVYNPLGVVDEVNWADFFEKFKMPDNLYERVSSNLTYYAKGYLRLAFLATLLISASKGDWLVRATICQYIIALLPQIEAVPLADVEYFRLIGLCFTQLLIWTSFIREFLVPPTTFFCAVVILAHATFRTRTWTRTVADFFKKQK